MTNLLLYLYIYSFLGWIYESTYDSIKKKKLINRGFMHGPFIPIYGMGGIICIQASTYANGSQLTTFIYAVVVCTIMELITGLVMEKLFKVRYWDYSQVLFNIKGYVCPPASLLWGIISLFLKNYVHIYIVSGVAYISSAYIEIFVYILTIIFVADFTVSFVEATDLRKMLEDIDLRNRKIDELRDKIEKAKDVLSVDTSKLRNFNEFRNGLSESKKNIDIALEDYYSTQREILDEMKSRLKEFPETKEKMRAITASINSVQNIMRTRISNRNKGIYHMLLRNPNISSKQYSEILDKLKNFNNVK